MMHPNHQLDVIKAEYGQYQVGNHSLGTVTTASFAPLRAIRRLFDRQAK